MASNSGSKSDLTAGLLLMAAAAAGIVMANTGLAPLYDMLRGIPMTLRVGEFVIDKPLLLWINDGLMAIFFFLVGLEIKRELLTEQLSSPSKAALPLVCAIGGMAIPALIYLSLNLEDPAAVRGWAIPAATDIAFALGVLAIAGSSVPLGIKVLLTAIAILDDLGAIIVIAVFYTENLSFSALGVWLAATGVLAVLNITRVTSIAPYALVGAIAWAALLKSGVHATLAGVVTALFIPIFVKGQTGPSPLHRLEHDLKPVVGFFIVPLFGFCNAGVSFAGMTLASFVQPITLGIAAGLFVGKQIGILVPLWLMVKSGLSRLPEGANWMHAYGMALLCGIGFTMSLFIGGLAFPDDSTDAAVRLGVLTGSILSAVVGLSVLKVAAARRSR